MSEMIDKAKAKITKGYSNLKKLLSLMMIWGLVFSLVTIFRLSVAFDYDETLVFSTPAFNKAYASGAAPFSPQFWKVVNQSYELEKPKIFSYVSAWALRLMGFRIIILAGRESPGGEALKKEWRHLVSNFFFVLGTNLRQRILADENFVLFFGDSDTDILECRKAHIFPLRIRRNPKSIFKEDYHPGALREVVVPFSEY